MFLEAFRAIEAALVKHDNNMKDYSPGWLITITANHSNYLVLWQSQHAVCHCQESGKNRTNYCNAPKWIDNIKLFEEERDVHSSSLNWCICSLFLTLIDGRPHDPGWEIPGPFFSIRAMLICSIIWLGKRMLRLLFCGFCSSLTWGCPRIQCRWFVLSEVVFTLSWCRSINTITMS